MPELRYLGDKTFEERYHLLLAHQKELATLQDRLMSHQVYLQHKIAFYQDKLK
ncbi:MAG: hypothetical protein Q4A81_04370 [Pasteurellaceae bacterium]|nr:hypothetical protein [Pasteurellaceae bacterium]